MVVVVGVVVVVDVCHVRGLWSGNLSLWKVLKMESSYMDTEEYRVFGAIHDGNNDTLPVKSTKSTKSELIRSIGQNIIGEEEKFVGPYGKRACIYADWTASGRALTHVLVSEILRYLVMSYI